MANTAPCPRCRERGNDRTGNNLHEYPAAFHCFACGYHKRKTDTNSIKRLLSSDNDADKTVTSNLVLAEKLPVKALEWLNNFQLYSTELAKFRYDYAKELLVIYFSNDYFQGRNFNPKLKAKYVSEGVKPFLVYGEGDTIVLVEDIISSIKVGRQFVGSPMLGSMPLKHTETRLKPFKNVILWGDYDKAKENLATASKLSERIGKPVKVIITELDPKCYSDREIKEIVVNKLN